MRCWSQGTEAVRVGRGEHQTLGVWEVEGQERKWVHSLRRREEGEEGEEVGRRDVSEKEMVMLWM